MIWKWNLLQSTSLTEAQKALEGHSCKHSVTNLSIIPHTFGLLTANVTCCIVSLNYYETQVNVHVVQWSYTCVGIL